MSSQTGRPGESTVLDPKVAVKKPDLFNVLLHNDHYTTMEFVVDVLLTVFAKPEVEAIDIMLQVHRNGVGVAGRYVFAVAEAKAAKVHSLAKEAGYPLRCSVEPE